MQKTVIIAVLIALTASLSALSQSLTAAQQNIYFGHPKSAVITNSQGTTTNEFDRQGRITSITQGNMRMVYDWAADNSSVTMSMYQGQNLVDSGTVEISVFTPREYKYNIGGQADMTVTFRPNGSIDKMVMRNPQMTVTMTYYYRSADDMYPYAVEQAMGEQSAKLSVTIDETDAMGNPAVYTQEMMGNKDVTRTTIEYYD